MGSLTRTTRRIFGRSASTDISKIKPVIPLQKYLDQAYKKVKTDPPGDKLGPNFGLKTCVPISIFLKSKGTGHEYAGVSDEIAGTVHHLDEEECFSGSLIKVAAMFAAFKLRAEARSLIADVKNGSVILTGATDPLKTTDFFNKLDSKFILGDAGTHISGVPGVKPKRPQYAQILRITGTFASSPTLNVEFTTDFNDHLRQMIIPSDNCSAGQCISRLSYPYINVKLIEAGFLVFDKDHPEQSKGIWLCGDYILTSPPFRPEDACDNQTQALQQTFVRITTVNDCDEDTHFCGSAQNTTSKQMARLFFKILLGELVDPESSGQMRALLREGQHGTPPGVPPPVWMPAPDPAFLSRTALCRIPLSFDIEGVKIGQGPIKKDTDRGLGLEVRSEGLIIKWKMSSTKIKEDFDKLNLTGEGVVCWQNFPNNEFADGIAEIINTSVTNFISQVPLTP